MTDILYTVAFFLNTLFADPFIFAFVIVLCTLCVYHIKKSYGFAFFLSLALTFASVHIIKSLYKIARPGDALVALSSYRFPSMHTAIATTALTSLAWYFCMRTTSVKGRGVIILLASSVAVFIGYTRIILGVHKISDVVVGMLLGFCISLGIHILMRRTDTK